MDAIDVKQASQTSGTPQRALVLGGGGAYGFAQAAYIEVALELGFVPDLIVGTSVGALNGAWVAMHPDDPGHLLEIWHSLGHVKLLRWSPASVARSVTRHSSICENLLVERLIAEHIGAATFADMRVPLAVVATNLTTASKSVFDEGSLAPAIRASTALPGFYEPVAIDGELYVDGCVSATVDIATALQAGCTDVLVIALGQPRGWVTPRSLVGVLRRSIEVMSYASAAAMIEATAGVSARVRVVRPDLKDESPWEIRTSVVTERRHRQDARVTLAGVLDRRGHVITTGISGEPSPLAWAAQKPRDRAA
jgi:NTE family protein